MSDLIYIKNASAGGGGGDATAANQTTQIGLETSIAANTNTTATSLNEGGVSAAQFLLDIKNTNAAIQSNTALINVSVAITSVTTNTTIAAGFRSYTFVNQGTQDATINTNLKLPVGSTFTIDLNRNEVSATAFTINFAITIGANVAVITKS